VIALEHFPALNASLNGATAALLLTGYGFIRRRRIAAHRACMTAALLTASLFLTSYVYYHVHTGSTPFRGRGWLRPVYFAILLSHTVLAATIPPLALVTWLRGWRSRHPSHERLARWTLPLWLYVSVTGVVIYLLLYRLPSGE